MQPRPYDKPTYELNFLIGILTPHFFCTFEEYLIKFILLAEFALSNINNISDPSIIFDIIQLIKYSWIGFEANENMVVNFFYVCLIKQFFFIKWKF